jgi:polyhydroxybutyrate depolymerase
MNFLYAAFMVQMLLLRISQWCAKCTLHGFSELGKVLKAFTLLLSVRSLTPHTEFAINENCVSDCHTDPPIRGVHFHLQTFSSFMASTVWGVLHQLASQFKSPSYVFCDSRSLVMAMLSFLFFVQAQDEARTLTFDGQGRTYLLHVPPTYDSQTPVPLLLMLHGRGGDGERISALTSFSKLANEKNFIVVYPDGIENQWNYVKDVPGYSSMAQDDTGFLLALLDEVSSQYKIDEKRVYVAGFSNGGFMTQRLACDVPERFAAFASVSAAGFGGMTDLCQTPSPLSLLLMHGTIDAVIPWQGLVRGNNFMLAPVNETLAFWASYSGCDGEITDTEIPQKGDSPDTSVTLFSVGCSRGNEILLYAVKGGGHNWPGVPGFIPEEFAGKVNTDIQASEVIWEFFSGHEKTEER